MAESLTKVAQSRKVRDAERTKLMLLGTGGGPTIHRNETRNGPASVLHVDNKPYLIDCGAGAPRQFLQAGMNFEDVDNIFITHQHFDHNSDLGNFMAYAWYAGRREPINVYGPPRLAGYIEDYVRLNSFDFELRERETGRSPFAPIPQANELDMEQLTSTPMEIMRDDLVSVTAVRVQHGLVPAVAYRFQTPDLSVTFSGDRGGEDSIVQLAQGSDVLVHEVLHYDAMLKTFPKANETVLAHYRNDHTSPQDVGRIAAEANVPCLVLNHILPDNDLVNAEEWTRLVRETYDGEILVGVDLMEV
ncbi:MBL fold metallo-hydrolase [Glutamicibacter uratoxydans]|uniref:MBL fold metallo-hydrolase n=1 Tax=Glutamicibacter uratoxydans TaxID=43667 RepID=UPI003D7020F5